MNLWTKLFDFLSQNLFSIGIKIISGIIFYIIGRKIIFYLNKIISRVIDKGKFDSFVASFCKNFAKIFLITALLFLIINFLGINNSFFVTLLASMGLAIGMALSGTPKNFSGGIVILFFRPYKVGDYILAQRTRRIRKRYPNFQYSNCYNR